VRNVIEIMTGYISMSEFFSRLEDLSRNKWNNLESLMKYNKENQIPATFFFGVNNGMGLDYRLRDAAVLIRKVMQEGFDVGVHGIAFDDYNDIRKEHDIFEKISGLKVVGIRMHYLRRANDTLTYLNETGYAFDTSLYTLKNPYKVGTMWEFPLHIMDGYVICNGKRWQNQSLVQSKDTTKEIIANCFNKGIKYFTVLFHDRYFSESFITWKEWYIWLMHYLKENKFSFTDYRSAIGDLEKSTTYVDSLHEANFQE
jgi:peptidoglycan/xylan/chitin deacetylase (PgdA/CDA1 family)